MHSVKQESTYAQSDRIQTNYIQTKIIQAERNQTDRIPTDRTQIETIQTNPDRDGPDRCPRQTGRRQRQYRQIPTDVPDGQDGGRDNPHRSRQMFHTDRTQAETIQADPDKQDRFRAGP